MSFDNTRWHRHYYYYYFTLLALLDVASCRKTRRIKSTKWEGTHVRSVIYSFVRIIMALTLPCNAYLLLDVLSINYFSHIISQIVSFLFFSSFLSFFNFMPISFHMTRADDNDLLYIYLRKFPHCCAFMSLDVYSINVIRIIYSTFLI